MLYLYIKRFSAFRLLDLSLSRVFFLPSAGAGGMNASGPWGQGKTTVLILLAEVVLR